jgi:hypothetical protein
MVLTSQQLKTTIEIFKHPDGSLDKLAQALDVSMQRATRLVEVAQQSFCFGRYTFLKYRTPPPSLGNPALVKHIISVRHVSESGWPLRDYDQIERARELYDAGTHEMCQGRSGSWIIQYLWKRRRPTKPRHFFRHPAILNA